MRQGDGCYAWGWGWEWGWGWGWGRIVCMQLAKTSAGSRFSGRLINYIITASQGEVQSLGEHNGNKISKSAKFCK